MTLIRSGPGTRSRRRVRAGLLAIGQLPAVGLLAVGLLAVGLLLGVGDPAAAQQGPTGSAPTFSSTVSADGQAYLDGLRWTRIQTEIRYLDPEGPAPTLPDPATSDPERAQRFEVDFSLKHWLSAAGILILAVLGYLLWRYGLPRIVAVRADPDTGVRARPSPPAVAASHAIEPISLAAITGETDRDRALAMLLDLVLRHAAAVTGWSLRRSQTTRDILRGLPAAWPHRAGLGRIAHQAELVRFGGIRITEEAFQSCLASARAIVGQVETGR